MLSESKKSGSPPRPPPSEDISRDDVRAQREAKKLAKAARKNKSFKGKLANPPTSTSENEHPVVPYPAQKSLKTGTTSRALEVKPAEANPSSQSVSIGVSADLLKSDSSSPSVIHSLFKPKKGKELAQSNVSKLYPPFYNVGLKVRNNVIRGANSQCVKLLDAIKDYVRCYDVPPGTTFKHGLFADLEGNMENLKTVCSFSISMSNAVQFLLFYLHNMPDDDGKVIDFKNEILDVIDQYIVEKIEKAVEAIVLYGLEKINEGDKIMVYSITEALMSLLVKAAEDGISYELILIQTRETKVELADVLEKLKKPTSDQTVRVSAVNFSSALYKIRSCSKLLMGGHGLFTNGGVMAQSGSGQLALVADTYNKPVVFLCETFKFCDRSPLDFLPLEEYMPEQFQTEDDFLEPKLIYDVTPSNLVTVVITDIDMLPSNGLAATLRVQEGSTPAKL
ncbi:unnamed protein product [Orchesella dallaii]|uniref:Translation initiation factor eIF2B subunit delta n=1 Tax=Orchesella dallaii TaxID=48710 RepID=A0ABP1RU03_9HEXA